MLASLLISSGDLGFAKSSPFGIAPCCTDELIFPDNCEVVTSNCFAMAYADDAIRLPGRKGQPPMSTEKRETRLSIRIDPALKEAAQNVANDKGMDLSTAVNMFLAKMVKDHALPFTPTSLPAETLQAFKEAKTPDKLEKYSTSDAMWTVLDV